MKIFLLISVVAFSVSAFGSEQDLCKLFIENYLNSVEGYQKFWRIDESGRVEYLQEEATKNPELVSLEKNHLSVKSQLGSVQKVFGGRPIRSIIEFDDEKKLRSIVMRARDQRQIKYTFTEVGGRCVPFSETIEKNGATTYTLWTLPLCNGLGEILTGPDLKREKISVSKTIALAKVLDESGAKPEEEGSKKFYDLVNDEQNPTFGFAKRVLNDCQKTSGLKEASLSQKIIPMAAPFVPSDTSFEGGATN